MCKDRQFLADILMFNPAKSVILEERFPVEVQYIK